MEPVTIRLPWPDSRLSPNARHDRRAISGVRAKHRRDAWMIALAALGVSKPKALTHIDLTFCPPDKRRRDLDNALATSKAQIDGIAAALGIDDSVFSLSLRWGEVVPRGEVRAVLCLPNSGASVPVPFCGVVT